MNAVLEIRNINLLIGVVASSSSRLTISEWIVILLVIFGVICVYVYLKINEEEPNIQDEEQKRAEEHRKWEEIWQKQEEQRQQEEIRRREEQEKLELNYLY